MKKLEIDDLIYDLIQIPDRENKKGELNQFWRDIESPHIKTSLIFCILNTLRTAPIEDLSGRQCRTVLARCQGYITMLDFSDTLHNAITKESEELEESPSSVEDFD